MSGEASNRLVVQVLSTDQESLNELRSLRSSDVVVGDIREVHPDSDLHLDLGQLGETLLAVTTVVTQVGGALQLLDWALSKVRGGRHKGIVIQVGEDRIEISEGADAQRVRQLLEAALHTV